MDGSWWAEIKPILGPLIQALVVLVVGTLTVVFQMAQARTARHKLISDLHDKRYKALNAYAEEAIAIVRMNIDGPKEGDKTFKHLDGDKLAGRRILIEELYWLFGEDVTSEADKMYSLTSKIILQMIHHPPTFVGKRAMLSDIVKEHQKDFFDAHQAMMMAARPYLYMGDIRRRIGQPDRWPRLRTKYRRTRYMRYFPK